MVIKNKFALIITIGFSISVFSQSPYINLIKKADSLYEAKNYTVSKVAYLKAFKIKKTNPSHLYYGACATALSGDQKEALNMLFDAVNKGWLYLDHMKNDPDLISLHTNEKWLELIRMTQKMVDKKELNYNKSLQKELLAINKDDQKPRQEYVKIGNTLGWKHPKIDSLKRIIIHNDSINLIKVKRILSEYGWVGKDVVGNEANSTLFMVLQHANINTQKEYLPMLKDAVKKGNARASSMAMLVDRIAVREGKKQIYGTQLARSPETEEYYVLPLKNPDEVNIRRKKVGLSTIQDYVSHWNLIWNVKEYKKHLPKYEQWLYDSN